MTIRGILFDNDGTLVDTHDLILDSMRYGTRAVLGRVIPDEQLMAKVGIPLAEQMLEFADSLEQRDELLRVYREYNHAQHDAAVKLFPGVAEGLAALQGAGFKMGVVTSKKHWLAQRGLEITGAWPYFAGLIAPDDCPESKPHPGPILAGARMLGLPPEECMYVGDAPFDIAAGNAAGCLTAAAEWGMFERADLAPENPDWWCADFADFASRVLRELA
jgi:pyrophosphatase PpaX